MRRAFRIFFVSLVVCSMALWPFTLVLWLHGGHTMKKSADGRTSVYNYHGRVYVTHRSFVGSLGIGPEPLHRWEFLGFGTQRYTMIDGAKVTVRLFHVWPVTALNLYVIGMWLARLRIRRRAAEQLARGVCPACGYDLRATPERCPECGRQPS